MVSSIHLIAAKGKAPYRCPTNSIGDDVSPIYRPTTKVSLPKPGDATQALRAYVGTGYSDSPPQPYSSSSSSSLAGSGSGVGSSERS